MIFKHLTQTVNTLQINQIRAGKNVDTQTLLNIHAPAWRIMFEVLDIEHVLRQLLLKLALQWAHLTSAQRAPREIRQETVLVKKVGDMAFTYWVHSHVPQFTQLILQWVFKVYSAIPLMWHPTVVPCSPLHCPQPVRQVILTFYCPLTIVIGCTTCMYFLPLNIHHCLNGNDDICGKIQVTDSSLAIKIGVLRLMSVC